MAAQRLMSGVRNATVALDPIYKSGFKRGLKVLLDVTAVPGVDTVQLQIYNRWNVADIQTLVAVARAGVGRDILTLYPGIPAVANVSANDVLTDLYRIYVAHVGVGNFTYSVEVFELD